MKRCNKCWEWKDESEFCKDKSRKDGLYPMCKKCLKEYRSEKKADIAFQKKDYYIRHKDSISSKKKEYRNNNKALVAKQKKESDARCEKRVKKTKAIYYDANKNFICDKAKEYRNNNKCKISEHMKEYYIANKMRISEYRKQYNKRIALYEAYRDRLTIDESPRCSSDGVSLEVKCRYCGRYTKVTNQQVQNRIRALNFDNGYECSLYCLGGNCQSQCPVFAQKKYPKGYKKATSREVNPVLRQLVLKRDEYTCQECGKTIDEAPLHVHHIVPVVHSPIEANDPDNCITLCKSCHKIAHSRPGCGYSELKCANDDKIKQDYEASKEEHLKMDDEQESDQTSTKE